MSKGLILTHKFHLENVEGLWKRDAIADCFTISTVSILPANSPKKIWVRISLKRTGLSGQVAVSKEEKDGNFLSGTIHLFFSHYALCPIKILAGYFCQFTLADHGLAGRDEYQHQHLSVLSG
jgi:hypothetical protein